MRKIGIIDDHTLFRTGLSRIINSLSSTTVCFQASDGVECLEKLSAHTDTDLILLDIKMPRKDGLETLEELRATGNNVPVLIISMHDDIPFVMQAMKLGAQGYILKDAEADELELAINKVLEIGFYLNDQLSRIMIQGIHTPALQNKAQHNFSDIELDILKLICQGLTSQEIADKIFRSRRTIEGHKQRLLDKTDTRNTPGLVAWAFRKGIVE